MKDSIKKIFRFFLKYTYPSLYRIEAQPTGLERLRTTIINSNISPKANITGPAQIAETQVGDYTYISMNATIHYTTIGKFCSIGPNLFCGWGVHPTNGLSTSPAFYSLNNQAGVTFTTKNKIAERLPITIGNDVFIGMNVTILDGVTIGDGAIIGAGAVVSKNIPPYAIAVGSPINIKSYRFTPDVIARLLEIQWWNFEEKDLYDIDKYFFNVDDFIAKYTFDQNNH